MVKTSLTTHSNRHRISSGSSRVQMRGSNQFKNKREKSSSNLNESATEPPPEAAVPPEEPQQQQQQKLQEVEETVVKIEPVVESPVKKEKSPKPIKKPGKRGGASAGGDRSTVSFQKSQKKEGKKSIAVFAKFKQI